MTLSFHILLSITRKSVDIEGCSSDRFGTAWAFWIDALIYTKTILHESYPFTYDLQGIVATVALIMMNLVSRDDLSMMADTYYNDEGSEVQYATNIGCQPFPSALVGIALPPPLNPGITEHKLFVCRGVPKSGCSCPTA